MGSAVGSDVNGAEVSPIDPGVDVKLGVGIGVTLGVRIGVKLDVGNDAEVGIMVDAEPGRGFVVCGMADTFLLGVLVTGMVGESVLIGADDGFDTGLLVPCGIGGTGVVVLFGTTGTGVAVVSTGAFVIIGLLVAGLAELPWPFGRQRPKMDSA